MTISVLRQSASLQPLEDQGGPRSPLGEPVSRFSGREVALAGAGASTTGIWECTPGRFERQLAQAEVMHILAGSCRFTPDAGEAIEMRAGDTLFFPADTRGTWEIRETLRKVYVVLASGST